MTIRVLLFAAAKERAGADSLTLRLDDGATVGALRRGLESALGDLLPRCGIAVNHEFAKDEQVLTSSDEVAVIPPVSGG